MAHQKATSVAGPEPGVVQPIPGNEEIALAEPHDIDGMLELQAKYLFDRGGLLSVAISRTIFEKAIADMPVIVARRNCCVIGYLRSSPLAVHAHVPIIEAMRRAYPGSADAYLYGPICVASLRAHIKMGMRAVGEFTHEGVAHAILSYVG